MPHACILYIYSLGIYFKEEPWAHRDEVTMYSQTATKCQKWEPSLSLSDFTRYTHWLFTRAHMYQTTAYFSKVKCPELKTAGKKTTLFFVKSGNVNH